jgi:hypothetical protein
MSEYFAIYTAVFLTIIMNQISNELTKIRKILESQQGLDKTDSDKKTVEAYK